MLRMHSMQAVTEYTAKSQQGFKSFATSTLLKAATGKEHAAAAGEFNLPPHGVCDVLSDGIDSYSL